MVSRMELLQVVFLTLLHLLLAGFVREQGVEKIGRVRDGRNPDPGSGPRKLTASVDPVVGSDGEGREACLAADLLGQKLIDRDVSVRLVGCLRLDDSGKKGVHREVAAAHPVVQSPVDGETFAVCIQRCEQFRGFPFPARKAWKQTFLLEAEKVSDRDEAFRTDSGASGGLNGREGFSGLPEQ